MIGRGRRFIVPEVIQTSGMDCGPASLKCLLEGFGIPVSYGRLREACQTDVDGTSIDTMEEIAVQLGLDAAQIMIPADFVFTPKAKALPALAVVRSSNDLLHFVILWSCHGGLVQVMDPATGRHWSTRKQVLDHLYVHSMLMAPEGWREWAGSDAFLDLVRGRMRELGVGRRAIKNFCDSALADESWYGLAALDAAARMVDTLVRTGALRRGSEARRSLATFLDRAQSERGQEGGTIPKAYWSVRPGPPGEDGEEQIILRGAVLLAVQGKKSRSDSEQAQALAPDLVAALAEKPFRPVRELFRTLRADGLLAPSTLFITLFVIAGALVVEGLLLRGLLDLHYALGLPEQRLGAMGLLVLFIGLIIGLQWITVAGGYRVGRRLETRLRMAFLAKIPRLGDRYFSSRPISDMAERGHSVHRLRMLPELGRDFVLATTELALTAVAIARLVPGSAHIAVLAALLGICLPLFTRQFIAELDLRVRTHSGALSRFYLDSLLGLVAIRTHGAEQSIRREHESLMMEWVKAGMNLQRTNMCVIGVQMLAGSLVTIWLLYDAIGHTSATSTTLLLVYWALNIPSLGYEIAVGFQEYPLFRNTVLRLLEPLGAPEAAELRQSDVIHWQMSSTQRATGARGMAVRIENVSVRAAGHLILDGIDMSIEPGSHVAVVGPSGAGKSSLIGLLLGWHQPAGGQVVVDDVVLTRDHLDTLRGQIAWVDPATQIWNASLLDNLRYGAGSATAMPLSEVIEQADLRRILEGLPDGLQTSLGEGGGLVSEGEGQRVRLGRAMMRPNVRLVILDEPFRGLDRDRRRTLLARTRAFWRDVTIICITHDVAETLEFDRVYVIEDGKLAESAVPIELAGRRSSRYRAMLDAERMVREKLWAHRMWRRLRIESGRLVEHDAGVPVR